MIQPVHLGHARSEEVDVLLFVLRRPDQLVLGVGDSRQDRAWRKCIVVHLQLAHAAADECQLIGGVVDGERLAEAEAVRVAPKDAQRGRVKRSDPRPRSDPRSQTLDAAQHLVGRFVRERHRQNVRRRHAALADQPGDAIRDHPRFARSGAGQNEQRTITVGDGLALLRVETAEVEHGGAW